MTTKSSRAGIAVAIAIFLGVPALAWPEPTETSTAGETPETMVLEGDEEVAELPSLTITGEDQIRIEYERPELRMEFDARSAPGLEWGELDDVVGETEIDLVAPLMAPTADQASVYLAKPWINQLKDGPVAVFSPASASAWVLGIWLFFLLQALYFAIFGVETPPSQSKFEQEIDPFERAYRRAEDILSI